MSSTSSLQAGAWRSVAVIKVVLGVSFFASAGFLLYLHFSGSHNRVQEDHIRSFMASNSHPLLQRAGAKCNRLELQQELHPETRLLDDLRLALSPRRVLVFNVCLALCFLLASFTNDADFAVSRQVAGVLSKEDCQWFCEHAEGAKRSLCDQKHLEYKTVFCPKDGKGKGGCVKPSERVEGVEYLPKPKCSFEVVPRERDVVIVLCSVVMGIFLVIEGVTTELVFVGMACWFAGMGIITSGEAFGGFASGSVLGLAFLFPVAAAVEETGVLDRLTGVLLGSPSGMIVALFRMMAPVALLSAFLSNTAIVTMMIPVIVSWAKRLDVSPGKLMMPLSFASQLGGSCTLIGSSHVLVAKSSVPQAEYDMQFFDLSPAGSLLALGTMVTMVLFLPLLPSNGSGQAPETRTEMGEEAEADVNSASPLEESEGLGLYELDFEVVPGGSQVGLQMQELQTQLERLPGVKLAKVQPHPVEPEAGSLQTTSLVSRLSSAITSLRSQGNNDEVQLGTLVHCSCTEQGVVTMRRVQGLAMGNDTALREMGRGYDRRYRHLYEVVLSPKSCLLDLPLDVTAFRRVLGACPIALRGKAPAPSTIQGHGCLGATPAAGDVLLLEADERYVGREAWSREFSVTSQVKGSSPQRVGGIHDQLRCVVVCCGMVLLCALQAADVVSVAEGAGVFVFLLVLFNAMTIQEVYSTIKVPILLVIAGASALSAALQATGLANFIALQVTHVALMLGSAGIQFAVYILSVGLSMFMNNSATVAILGPLAAGIAASSNGAITVKSLIMIITFGAGTCLTTPLGYQTNLMVMKDGGYTFGSFMKYGAPVQVVHMLLCVGLVRLLGY